MKVQTQLEIVLVLLPVPVIIANIVLVFRGKILVFIPQREDQLPCLRGLRYH